MLAISVLQNKLYMFENVLNRVHFFTEFLRIEYTGNSKIKG